MFLGLKIKCAGPLYKSESLIAVVWAVILARWPICTRSLCFKDHIASFTSFRHLKKM